VPGFAEIVPALTTLWLDGEDFLFHWRGSLNGVEKGFITADESECLLFKRTITPSHTIRE
jgi:hypothetical protein